MRVLYGGTFDPVHEGHLAIARVAASALGTTVALVPAADPPHRATPGAAAEHREAMLQLAVADDHRLAVDRRELERRGPSFTIDTLAAVRAEVGPSESLVWVLGLDSLAQLDTWREWRRIFDLAHLLAFQRPETEAGAAWLLRAAPAVHAEVAARWRRVGDLAADAHGGYAALQVQPLRQESATEVRRRIALGVPWSELVPAPVAAYIQARGLYRPAAGS